MSAEAAAAQPRAEHSLRRRSFLRTKARLLLTRLFLLTMGVVMLLGRSRWSVPHAPMLEAILYFSGVVLALAGFFGRLWCLGYIAKSKGKALVTTGPYSLCRHPLYLFSLPGGLGLALCTATISIPVAFVLAFLVYYPFAIRTEEQKLDLLFPDYPAYRERTPALFPTWKHYSETDALDMSPVSFRRYLIEAAGYLSVIGVLKLLEGLHEGGQLPTLFLIP